MKGAKWMAANLPDSPTKPVRAVRAVRAVRTVFGSPVRGRGNVCGSVVNCITQQPKGW